MNAQTWNNAILERLLGWLLLATEALLIGAAMLAPDRPPRDQELIDHVGQGLILVLFALSTCAAVRLICMKKSW